MMRKMGINRAARMISRRKNNRNTLLISLLGIGIAGGATAYMTKGKTNGNMKKMVNQLVKKTGNINLNGMLKTTSQ